MFKLGLTGSIGMGKSATAHLFREQGVSVYDADAAVHALYAPGGEAVPLIEEAFPGVTSSEKGVDRSVLRKRFLADPESVRILEAIVHPLVARTQEQFLRECELGKEDIVVLDIPLLFETGGEKRVDAVVVVSAPANIQKQRVLEREGMTEEAFEGILAKQTSDVEKRRRADYVIDTSKGFDHARERIRDILREIRSELSDR